jgi:hypothetical protein
MSKFVIGGSDVNEVVSGDVGCSAVVTVEVSHTHRAIGECCEEECLTHSIHLVAISHTTTKGDNDVTCSFALMGLWVGVWVSVWVSV